MAGTAGKLVQPSVVRLRSGALRAFFRSRDADWVYVSDSADDGATWSAPKPTALPNNNSGLQAAMLPDGRLVIVFNNVAGREHRWPLSVAMSEARGPARALTQLRRRADVGALRAQDEGATWSYVRDLEPDFTPDVGEAPRREDGEYSYPSVLAEADGTLHVSYTMRSQSIRYVRLTPGWVEAGGSTGVFQGSAAGVAPRDAARRQ